MKFSWDNLTEETRLNIEQEQSETGFPIYPSQIWRDGEYIPEDPDTVFADKALVNEGKYFSKTWIGGYGQKTFPILKYCLGVPLLKVPGTLNIYSHELLKDALDERFGEKYTVKIYINDQLLSYGVGDTYIDQSAGYLVFKDKNFLKDIKEEDEFTATFYKYIGRKGFFGSSGDEIGISYPFADDRPLMKSADDENHLAMFKVKGGEGVSKYIIPPTNTFYYKRSDIEIEENMHVIMTQENMNSVIDTIGIVNGGVWLTKNN